jgi:hypothetical protein
MMRKELANKLSELRTTEDVKRLVKEMCLTNKHLFF